jgi:hypothetical protein
MGIKKCKSLVIKSGSQTLQTEGNTEVYILPAQWHLSWKGYSDKKLSQNKPYIQVKIIPESGKTVSDYVTEFIQLNNVKAVSVQVLTSMIKAYFDVMESIESLGQVEVDQWYPVVISGTFKNGGFWGGGQKVTIRP